MKLKISLTFFTLLILLQFYPYSLPEVNFDKTNDFLANNEVPKEVADILKNSCYDCHSNQTIYPWYSFIAPVKFLVGKDTEEGRNDLNFSDWETFSTMKKIKYSSEISESIEEDEMPYPIYLITHRDAILSEEQKQIVIEWFDDYAGGLLE